MKKISIEIRRPLAKLDPRQKIGGTSDPELMKVSGQRKIYVFADTETFYITHGLEPWKHMGKPRVSSVLRQMSVRPFILSWQFRRYKRSRAGNYYESGGVYDRCYYVDHIDKIESLLIDLSYIFQEWGYTPILTFHNASYDLSVLEPLFRYLDPQMIFYFYTDDDHHFIRGSMQSPKYGFFCEFHDTLKYDKSISLDKAGEILGLPKLKGLPYAICDVGLDNDHNIYYNDLHTGERRTFSLDKYMEYARRDVSIARKFHDRMERQRFLVNEIMVEDWSKMKQWEFNKRCSTRPSHSKHICNKYLEMKGWAKIDEVFHYDIDKLPVSDPMELYRQNTESNCGGFTSVNKDIFKYDCPDTHHIKYFDRNSMYPTIMTEPLPYGVLLREKPDDGVTWYVISLTKCEWKGALSCLKTQAFGRKKINEHRPFFVEKEYLDFVIANCDIEYEVVDIWYQQKTRILQPLINMYYERRKECRREMKRLEEENRKKSSIYEDLNDQQNGLKLLMNSLYGKLCEKGHHSGTVYYQGQYTNFVNEHIKYPCILTGSFITYRGRLSLLQKIKATTEAGYDFLYADTDSVVLGCPKDADLTLIFGKDEGNLGEWKEEGTFDLFLNIGIKKKYILINRRDRELPVDQRCKLALSGIPKPVQVQIRNKLRNNFDEAVEDLIFMFDPTNNVLIECCRPTTARTLAHHQPVIYHANFKMNPSLKKISGIIRIGDEGFTLTKCTN